MKVPDSFRTTELLNDVFHGIIHAIRHRNQGRRLAMKRHPFKGVCEVSRHPLERKHAHLDEMQSELGYSGEVRWTCPKANNSGPHSCGKCYPRRCFRPSRRSHRQFCPLESTWVTMLRTKSSTFDAIVDSQWVSMGRMDRKTS